MRVACCLAGPFVPPSFSLLPSPPFNFVTSAHIFPFPQTAPTKCSFLLPPSLILNFLFTRVPRRHESGLPPLALFLLVCECDVSPPHPAPTNPPPADFGVICVFEMRLTSALLHGKQRGLLLRVFFHHKSRNGQRLSISYPKLAIIACIY